MSPNLSDVHSLANSLLDEIVNAVGLKQTPAARWTFGLFFRRVSEHLSHIAVTADEMIASQGFSEAAAWMMSHWVKGVASRGAETIPAAGPLLVISNHCGAYDFLVLPALLKRADLSIIASGAPFLKSLPHASEHLIFISNSTQDRMNAARAGIRHLQNGGALLLFGTGLVDPDPGVYPNADREIENWSSSIDLFLRQVPGANVVLAIVSGIISPKWAYHPITRLRRIDWQKRRLAEFGQVIRQLFFPDQLYVSPRVSFAPPVTVDVLRRESNTDRLLPAVIVRGQSLLARHIAWLQESTKK